MKSLIALLIALLLAPVAALCAADKPNVIVILMDDLGWNDLGYTGSKFYETPNLDRLAARGMMFTRAYAAPICSPSRASILTGLDPARTGFTLPTGGDKLEILKAHVQPRIYSEEELRTNWQNLPGGLKAPPNQRALQVVSVSRLSTNYPSIGKIFKANGYRTAHFGKWHVGPAPYSPLEHGFDVDVPHINSPGPPRPGHFGPWSDWEEEKGPAAKGRQVDDVLADHAIKFIQENKDRPFYMNFWTYGVHIPFQARKETIAYFTAKADPKAGQRNPVYAGMIKHTDDAIGRVWKAVEEAGLADKTVVVFYSDNGGVNWGSPIPITDNSPLRGGKGDIYEGGIRVPGFVIWPGVTKPGAKCDLPLNTRDLFPTLAEICSLKNLPTFDGRSIVPAITGKAMEEKPIFTHYPHYGGGWSKGNSPSTSVMSDGWKLIRFYFDGPGQKNRYELYNLKTDPGETLDHSRRKPELVAKLEKLMDDFLKQTGAVLPQPNSAYRGAIKGEFDGIAYEVLEPAIKRGVKFPLVVCLEGDGNPAYAELHKLVVQHKHPMFLLALKSQQPDKTAALIRKVLQDYPIQPRSVYLTGEGTGAADVWKLASRHPELFAAAMPVGAAGTSEQIAAMKDLPVLTKYTEASPSEPALLDHVWSQPEVLEWLFAQVQPVHQPANARGKGRSDAGPSQADSAQNGKHLFILSGQSNMASMNPDESFTPAVEKAFGKDQVIVVKKAWAGCPIRIWCKDWKPAPDWKPTTAEQEKVLTDKRWYWPELVKAVTNATKGATIKTVTFVWMQGESDAMERHDAVYEESLKGVIRQLENDLGYRNIHVVIGRISDFGVNRLKSPNWIAIRDIQVRLAESNPSYGWVDTDDLNDGINAEGKPIQDDLHFSVEGYRVLGERFAQKAVALIRQEKR